MPIDLANGAIYVYYWHILILISAFVGSRLHIISRISHSDTSVSFCCKYVPVCSSIFWDIMPCSPLKVNRRFGGICGLRRQCYSSYSSTLKMEATFSSETSVDFQLTTQRYRTLHNHRSEDLKSYTMLHIIHSFYVYFFQTGKILVTYTDCYDSSEISSEYYKIIGEKGFSCSGSDHMLSSVIIVLEGSMF
jgi:hypothetical protein